MHIKDYEKIEFPISAQFHVLLHFNSVDDKYRELLLKNGITNEQIEQKLAEDRSKFDEDFATNPVKLWQKLGELIDENNYYSINKADKKVIIFNVRDEIVGLDNLYLLPISADSVSLEDSNHEVKIIKIHGTPVETNQVNCVLRPVKDSYELVTMFPGVYAPPFPNSKNQNTEDYSESTLFWKTHAIIINH